VALDVLMGNLLDGKWGLRLAGMLKELGCTTDGKPCMELLN